MNQGQEAPLIQAWLERRDGAAADSLYRLWLARIQNLALAWCGGRVHEAEDLTQEIFLALFRDLGGFRGDAPFQSWFHALARRRAKDFMRSAARSRRRLEALGPGEHMQAELRLDRSDPHYALERQVEADRVFAALDCLSHQDRTLLVLAELEDFSIQEVCRIMGMKEGTVKSRLSRGRKKLARLLGKEAEL